MLRTPKRWLTVAAATLLITGVVPGSIAFADDTPGIITGHLLDGTTPIVGAEVDATAADGSFGGGTTTDATGAFTLTDVTPGSYVVGFELPGGLRQFFHGQTDFSAGTLVTVTAGGTSTVEETAIPHGRLTGRVTNSDGTPAPNLDVSASNGTDVFLEAQTDANGVYTIAYAPPGSYTLTFFDFATRLSQTAHQKVNGEPGDPFVVTVGATTTVDEQLVQTGAITGHLTTPDGTPVPFAMVTVSNPFQQVSTTTSMSGTYRVPVYPGTYTVQFQLPGGLVEWAHQQTTRAGAASFTVTAGVDTVVDEQTLPTGTLTGRLVNAAGSPQLFTQVNIVGGGQNLFATTSTDGNWHASVFPGTYKIGFTTLFGTQWATGKPSFAAADNFTVAGGQTVRADDALAATGTMTVTARDAVTGASLTTFCAFADNLFNSGCTNNGTLVLAALPGTYRLGVNVADSSYLFDDTPGIIVQSGQNTAVEVAAIPAATITTTVKDAKTGTPLANVCLRQVVPTSPGDLALGAGFCSDGTGQVRITGLRPGPYNLFAFANDNVHGDQWVGPHGGVGAMKKASVITVATGQTLAIAPVRMDKRGTLTGIIKDKATGAPLPGATAAITTEPGGLGSNVGKVVADANGRYTFTTLGPYEWPILFQSPGYADEWSGHTGNRLQANPITVKAGKTKSHDERMSRGLALTGVVTTATGGTLGGSGVRIRLFNAASRDELSAADTATDDTYVLRVLPRQNVILGVDGFVDNRSYTYFYVNSPDFDHATAVHIPQRGTVTVNIALPTPN